MIDFGLFFTSMNQIHTKQLVPIKQKYQKMLLKDEKKNKIYKFLTKLKIIPLFALFSSVGLSDQLLNNFQ